MKKSWDKYFIDMIPLISSRSKDRSTKVGCVIVGPDKEIRSTGYNSFPRGMPDDLDKWHERPKKYDVTAHAEVNAIYNLARMGLSAKDCTIYISWFPCCHCTLGILQSGIREIVIDGQNFFEDWNYWKERWEDKIQTSFEMIYFANIPVRIFRSEEEIWEVRSYLQLEEKVQENGSR